MDAAHSHARLCIMSSENLASQQLYKFSIQKHPQTHQWACPVTARLSEMMTVFLQSVLRTGENKSRKQIPRVEAAAVALS